VDCCARVGYQNHLIEAMSTEEGVATPPIGAPDDPLSCVPAPPVPVPVPAPPVAAPETDSQCVKVCVRVRPLSSNEERDGSNICVKFPVRKEIIIGKDRKFTFDNVFSPVEGQQEVG
jgi:hypothetical protein